MQALQMMQDLNDNMEGFLAQIRKEREATTARTEATRVSMEISKEYKRLNLVADALAAEYVKSSLDCNHPEMKILWKRVEVAGAVADQYYQDNVAK